MTCEWLAWLVYSKFVLLTPLDRLRRDLNERGIPIAMSTLVSLIERVADLLAPIDGLHWRKLLSGTWMATDGTGPKVLIPQLPTAHNGYIELYRNQELALLQYEADKCIDSVVSKLAPFHGTLTADAEHRYNAVFESGDRSGVQRTRTTQVPRRRGNATGARCRGREVNSLVPSTARRRKHRSWGPQTE